MELKEKKTLQAKVAGGFGLEIPLTNPLQTFLGKLSARIRHSNPKI